MCDLTSAMCRYGPAVLAGEREAAGKLVALAAALWFLAILLGCALHSGVPCP